MLDVIPFFFCSITLYLNQSTFQFILESYNLAEFDILNEMSHARFCVRAYGGNGCV